MACQTLASLFRPLPSLLLAATLSFTPSVHAEPSAADKLTARNLLLDGRRLLESGDARAALAKFQAAHAIMGVPTTGRDVAKALEALGQLIEARAMAYEVTQMPATPNESQAFKDARAEAAAAVEALDTRIPSLVLRIEGAPKEAVRATVDGEKVPAALLAVPLVRNPGKHEVVATASGYRELRTTVELTDGAVAPVEVPVRLEREARDAVVEALPKQMKDEPGKSKGLIYGGAGLAGALAVVGVGTAIGAAMAEQKSLDDWNAADCTNRPTPKCYEHFDVQENKRFLLGNTAVWTFLGAGAVGAGTLVYALVAKKPEVKPAKEAVWVAPTVGGAVIRGTF